MAFYQYHYDKIIFNKLPFIEELVAYMYMDTSRKVKKGFLCSVSEIDYQKINDQLVGERKVPETPPIVANDKVFILPNCSIPGFKIKEYLKSVGAIQVNDIKEANKIIGHDNIRIMDKHANSALLKKYSSYYDGEVVLKDKKQFNTDTTAVKTVFRNSIPELEVYPSKTVLDTAFSSWYYRSEMIYDLKWFITPTCAMIMYYKLLNKIPVINEDVIFQLMDKPLVIDKYVYKTLADMMESEDKSNQITAIEIISNCNKDKSLYYIWKLTNNYFNKFDQHKRNKNFRLFREKVNYYSLLTTGTESMLTILEKENLLTKEIYTELITELVEIYGRRVKSQVFDVTLTPTSKYIDYITPTTEKFVIRY